MYGNNISVESVNSCRNFEADAKNIKKRIVRESDFHISLGKFLKSTSVYNFDRGDDIKTLTAIYGSLSLSLPDLEKEYDMILKKIEEGK